jgi:hypothetical protein
MVGLATYPFFLDDNVTAKSTYYYRIAPIDTGLFEGEPTDPISVETTLGIDLSVDRRAGGRERRQASERGLREDAALEASAIGSERSRGEDCVSTLLFPAWPNPARPQTRISFRVGEREIAQGTSDVTLVVYDISGRRVRELLNENVGPGVHEVAWDGTDDSGKSVASGCYLYTLTVGDLLLSDKITLIK